MAFTDDDLEKTLPLKHCDPLSKAVDLFRADPDLRMAPVLSEDNRLIGGIFERDLQRLLFSPYGHSLLSNPGVNEAIGRYLRPCPSAEVTDTIAEIFESYRASRQRDGIVITQNGVYRGVLPNQAIIDLAAARDRELASLETIRLQRIEAFGHDFHRNVRDLASVLADTANEIQALAQSAANGARSTAASSTATAHGADTTRAYMGEIVADTDRLVGEYSTVRRNVSEARRVRGRAMELVRSSGERAGLLIESTNKIDDVVQLIDAICRKANLLAVNAAIEAAHAGDAGRGFAVLATEVRALAAQTRTATVEIGNEVAGIRSAIDQAVTSYSSIEEVFTAIDQAGQSIEAAVAREGVIVESISDRAVAVERAAEATWQNIATINTNAETAGASAAALEVAAGSVLNRSLALDGLVVDFVSDVTVRSVR